MLCAICQEIPSRFFFGDQVKFRADESGAKYFELPFSVTALRTSAKSGCELCMLLSDNLVVTHENGEADAWSTCSSEDSLPANDKIRVSASSHNSLRFIGMKRGVARRGALQYDAHGK
jgi:hypothetical protein